MSARIISIVLLLFSGQCLAWTDEQKILAGVAYTAMVIDYGQTRTIAKTPWFHENNPMLPKYPTISQVNRHFAIAAVASYLIAENLPSEQRTWFLRGLALVQVGVVAHNVSLGIRMDF